MSGTVAALTTVAGIVKEWLSNDAKEDAQRTKVDLAVVEATGQVGRILSLVFLFGSDAAPLLPWVEVADVVAYKEGIAQATPGWEQAAKQAAIFGMWGASEKSIRRSHKARAEKNRQVKSGEQSPDMSHRPDGPR